MCFDVGQIRSSQQKMRVSAALFQAALVTLTSEISAFTVGIRNQGRDTFFELSASPIVVALTREDGKNGKLQKELSGRFLESISLEELPCIAHADGADFEKLESTLKEQDWDYVAVTSPTAATVLSGPWKKALDGNSPEVVAVGKATQSTLEKMDIPVAFCPSKATAKTLVSELPKKRDGTTLLYPASAKAAATLEEGLTQRGFEVRRLDTYDTVTATWTEEEKAVASQVRVACFGSPSAVKGWLKNTGNNREILAACIGETSAKACRENEWPESRIFFPEKPGIAGWADAVEHALKSVDLPR